MGTNIYDLNCYYKYFAPKKKLTEVPVEEQRRGRICYTMHPPARNSRSQTGTPGASRAGGHRASALHTVRRVPLVAPLPAYPAVPSRVQLSSAEMDCEGPSRQPRGYTKVKHVPTRGLAESEGVDGHQEGSLGVVPTGRPQACKHTQTHTRIHKNPLGRIPCFFVETNNKYQKETDFTSETLSSFSTNIGAPLYDQVCIIIHPYQHRRMSGFLSFCRLNCIQTLRSKDICR